MLFANVFSAYLLYTFLSGNISIRVLDFKQIESMTKASVVVFAGLFIPFKYQWFLYLSRSVKLKSVRFAHTVCVHAVVTVNNGCFSIQHSPIFLTDGSTLF